MRARTGWATGHVAVWASLRGATFSYTSTTSSSGVLTVTSGGTLASIDLSGHYTQASFHITSGVGGSAEIFDPPLIAQQSTIGLPDTLGYVEKVVETVVGDILTGKIALLCNYIAAGLPTVPNGQSETPLSEVVQSEQRPLLTNQLHR